MSGVMRWKRAIAALSLGALLLSPIAEAKKKSHQTITVPASEWTLNTAPNFRTLDHRLDSTRPAVTSLENRIYGPAPTNDGIPAIAERIKHERLLLTAIPSTQAYYFDSATLQPFAIAELKLGTASYKKLADILERNDDENREDRARIMMANAAQAMRPSVARQLGVKEQTIGYRIGYATMLAQGLQRAEPYLPYFEALAKKYGLDPRIPLAIAIQETDARNIVSSAKCEGWFQMGRTEARANGLIVPNKKEKGVNENNHPILQAEAALSYLWMLTHANGDQLSAISSYHTGVMNVYTAKALALQRNPQLAERLRKAILLPFSLATIGLQTQGTIALVPSHESLVFDPEESATEENVAPRQPKEDPEPELRAPLESLAWAINGGFRDKQNHSGYKEVSAQYVPRILAIMSAAVPQAAQPFSAERVTVLYEKQKRLTAQDILKSFRDAAEFERLNPHIPLAPVRVAKGKSVFTLIPEGTRVFVPLGTGQQFINQYQLLPSDIVRYDAGVITPQPELGPWTQADTDYAAIARRRAIGGYEAVKRDEIVQLRYRNNALLLEHPSERRRLEQRALTFDEALYGMKGYDLYIAAANGKQLKRSPLKKRKG